MAEFITAKMEDEKMKDRFKSRIKLIITLLLVFLLLMEPISLLQMQ
jgi:uncharacterized membrane protein